MSVVYGTPGLPTSWCHHKDSEKSGLMPALLHQSPGIYSEISQKNITFWMIAIICSQGKKKRKNNQIFNVIKKSVQLATINERSNRPCFFHNHSRNWFLVNRAPVACAYPGLFASIPSAHRRWSNRLLPNEGCNGRSFELAAYAPARGVGWRLSFLDDTAI